MQGITRHDEAIAGNLLERIIEADCGLIVLRCDDEAGLLQQLRWLALHTGQAMYLWREGAGLRRMREGDEEVPGCRHIADVLRYVIQSAHFGVYFLAGSGAAVDSEMVPLLRRVSRADGQPLRRVVLLDPPPSLPAGVGATELVWAVRASSRPRLRDGRWVR
jgi:hypothetical protein